MSDKQFGKITHCINNLKINKKAILVTATEKRKKELQEKYPEVSSQIKCGDDLTPNTKGFVYFNSKI